MNRCIQCQTETEEKLICGFCSTCLENHYDTGEHTVQTRKEIKLQHKTKRIQMKGARDEKKNKKTIRRVVHRQRTINMVPPF